MSITVIPAYRVIAKFAKQAQGLPFEDGITVLEENLRAYVRNLLSTLHPSLAELGERAAVTQLGDPDPEALLEALGKLESGSPKAVVEDAIAIASKQLARPAKNRRSEE